MEAERVHDDHRQNSPKHFLFAHDEMESGVEDYRLPRDHAIPSNCHNGHAKIEICGQLEELEEKTQSVKYTAIAADQERPKV